jgi:hypothetical protein
VGAVDCQQELEYLVGSPQPPLGLQTRHLSAPGPLPDTLRVSD